MDSFNYGKALSEMWTLGGKAFLEAQQQALRAMRDGAAAMGLPAGMSRRRAARRGGADRGDARGDAARGGGAGAARLSEPRLRCRRDRQGGPGAGRALDGGERPRGRAGAAAAAAGPARRGRRRRRRRCRRRHPGRRRTRRWPPPCGGWWTRGSGWAPATTWRKRCSAWRKGRASPTCGTASAASPGCSGPGWRSAAAASSTRRWCWRAGQRRPGASPNASASAPRRRRRAARPRRPFFPRAPRSTSGSRPRTGRCWRCSARSATSSPRRSS